MPALLFPFAWLALQALLLGLGTVTLGWNLVCVLLHPLLPMETGRRIGRAAISLCYRWFWRVAGWSGMLRMDASALDALADEPRLIVIANHPSLLDALMLVARMPRSFCVMKASLSANPLLGPGARLARYVRNDSALGLVRSAVAELRTGGQLVMFPEGTRTTTSPINAFRPGFALVAKLANVPIQSVFIETTSPYLGKGWPLWRLPALPIEFKVRLGRRFEPSRDPLALLAVIEAYYAQQLGAIPTAPTTRERAADSR
jgi:1-acyl-sn-glycerol-3-phosphate acyltransferase